MSAVTFTLMITLLFLQSPYTPSEAAGEALDTFLENYFRRIHGIRLRHPCPNPLPAHYINEL
ncbi:hypothetical protein Tcan_07233 [Toxocara canis]|uniref:Uncharacterized protein n=1 Tax=Toxocara canis TaxID=6265 RepID=A0A0B2UV52_TOXCA|nr:hypothetical protein Tcan_07233 [Toxocara canis]